MQLYINKKFGYHHFLLALLPVLLISLDNINEIPIYDIIVPLFLSLAIVFVPWMILTFFIGQKKSAVIISLLIIMLMIFAYTRLVVSHHEILDVRFISKNIILIPIFSLPTIFIIIKILRQEFSSNITQIINVVSIAVVGLMIFQVGLFYSEDISIDQAQELLNVPLFEIHDLDQRPNVYLLLLDAYSGDITLKNDFDFDNSKFYKQLEERGFFVQKDSFSNYPNTAISMPSIMNMNYLDFISQLPEKKSSDLRIVQELANQNKVMQVFESVGYEIYSFHGNYGRSDIVTENFCRYNLDLNPELAYALINYYIPISDIREKLFEQQIYDTVLCVFDTTRDFENPTKKSFYMHMHVLFPHEPFLFDSEGNKVKATYSENRFDSELKESYLQQLIFANKKTLEIIDSIQQRNSNDVIILMSDHGGRFGVNWAEPSEMDYFRGLENLYALYFPGNESDIPTSIATVNTFRVFFNTYFNTDYEILDEKFYWYEPESPFIQKDITELIKSSSLRE
ncbi:MAG: hypothetical protein CXT78_10300 [Thaumarchaeota archaeon]|nr:MAG: hypothetical protein CXT78_10300 [Nitrososphaerota archaeon]